MSIEGIVLINFWAIKHNLPLYAPPSHTCNVLFHYFFLVTENMILPPLHHTSYISLNFLRRKKYPSNINKIWDNKYGCTENYRCATALFLLLMLSQDYNIIIDNGVSILGHDRDVVDELNATNNRLFTI